MEREKYVKNFAEKARRYCAFIEGAASSSLSVRIQYAREILSELIHAACQLPEGDGDSPDVDAHVPIPSDWPGFGEADIYWEFFDPYEEDSAVVGSLSDDLLDIYLDLRSGLIAYDEGLVGSAAWEWKFNFANHWGDHAVDALRALQRACSRFDFS